MYDLKILKISLPWKYLKVKLENVMLKIVHVGYVKHIWPAGFIWIAFASYNQIFTIFLISYITKLLAGRGVVRDNYLLVAFVKSRE